MDELAQRYIGHGAEAEIEAVSPEPQSRVHEQVTEILFSFQAILVLSE